MSPRDLEDTYLAAFRATVVEGHADSIMCAYNAIDGEPACANTYLLQTTLRQAWHFQGFVTSDCGAVGDITSGHHFTPDNERGAVAAVRAGTDTTCGEEYVTLVKAVQDGLIRESEIDTALKRLFTARIRLGMFDPPASVAFNRIPMSQDDSAPHRQLALEAAREAMVLLKNENGVLPFGPGIRRIAVVGPNAESLTALEGNYKGTPSHPVFPVRGLRRQFAGKAEVLYAQGSAYVEPLPLPAPSSVFRAGGPHSEAGLRAEYFANAEFSGRPAVTRIDPQIQFDWDAASPAPGIPLQAFSVRWSGSFTPPGAGDYTFTAGEPECWPCDDRETYWLYLDGKLATEGMIGQAKGNLKAPHFEAHFADSRPHDFRLEYAHRSPQFAAGAVLNWQPPSDVLRNEAVQIARQADVVVAFVGLSPRLEGEEMSIHVEGFSGGDRTDIGLPRVQQELLEALAATGKPLVVVLLNGSALAVNWANQHAAAILEAWYPGEEGGTAIAETLAGANNPGGRLPVTFYASLDQLPPFDNYAIEGRTYRYFSGKPLFPFGYGLSYSTFSYSNLRLSNSELPAGQPLTVQANVRNTSTTGGDEVVELYLEDPPSPAAPLRALRGFARIHLAPGESRPMSFNLSPRDLSQVTEKGEHRILPGAYTVYVGGGQPGEAPGGVQAKFQITGEASLPR